MIAEVRKARGEAPVTLVQDVVTRWNSTFEMSRSVNLLQPDLQQVLNSTTLNEGSPAVDQSTVAIAEGSESDDEDMGLPDVDVEEEAALPRDHLLTEREFSLLRSIEGFASMTSQVTTMLEGELYVQANVGLPALKVLLTRYKEETLIIPALLTSADKLKDRKFLSYEYSGRQPCIRIAKQIMVDQMTKRFFTEDANDNDLKSMFLDPSKRHSIQSITSERLATRARNLVVEAAKSRVPNKFYLSPPEQVDEELEEA